MGDKHISGHVLAIDHVYDMMCLEKVHAPGNYGRNAESEILTGLDKQTFST